ncbi:hypothetical protein MXB_1311 [Myxobolus squamalis]|nr:hypothetical protein MXB_1311 [Myxobolus squamalis]
MSLHFSRVVILGRKFHTYMLKVEVFALICSQENVCQIPQIACAILLIICGYQRSFSGGWEKERGVYDKTQNGNCKVNRKPVEHFMGHIMAFGIQTC